MSLESPLNKVLGLGSAKEGTGHWWAQRLTAAALIPLGIWFAWFLLSVDHGDFALLASSIGKPVNAILLVLLLLSLIYHSSLGVQVIVEDYVHGAAKVITLVALQFAHIVLAVAGIFSVVTISVGLYR